jgi:protein-L-isoaspartate(D-aspartate) O-methyltransferase
MHGMLSRETPLELPHNCWPAGGPVIKETLHGCRNNTGELAAFLAGLGYTVDAVDFAEGALTRARKEQEGAEGVRWLCLDIEHDDPAELNDDGYDLVTMRLAYPFVRDRARVVRGLGDRLRPGGALVVITPVAASTPEERRLTALDEDEIGLLTEGWEQTRRCDAEGLAFVILRGPGGCFDAVGKGRPEPQAASACALWSQTPPGGPCSGAPPATCGNSLTAKGSAGE